MPTTMNDVDTFWRSIASVLDEDRLGPPEQEGPGYGLGRISRRRFLSLLAASAALAGATGCRRPTEDRYVVPYTTAPEGLIPGLAQAYATTWQEGTTAHALLVKAREGRPILIEGNDLHPLSKGKTTVRAQAQILSLYDANRIRGPLHKGSGSTWEAALTAIHGALERARRDGRQVVLLTGAVLSPSFALLAKRFQAAFPGLRHVAWEPGESGSARAAAQECFGEVVIPRYRFDRARVVLSLQDDFLGSGCLPAVSSSEFVQLRRVQDRRAAMSRLYVAEGRMTLTGCNADRRLSMKPTHLAALGVVLAQELHRRYGVPLPVGVDASVIDGPSRDEFAGASGIPAEEIERLARDLAAAVGEALVLAGPELPAEAHVVTHLLNGMLGTEGRTLETETAVDAPPIAGPAAMESLRRAMAGGQVEALLVQGANPCYAAVDAAAWKEAIRSVPLSASFAVAADETSEACTWVLPVHHWLEAWGDRQFTREIVGLQQPLIAPLYDTRQTEDVLLELLSRITGEQLVPYREFVRQRWREHVYPRETPVPFERFWHGALHDGFVRCAASPRSPRRLSPQAVAEAVRRAVEAQRATTAGSVLVLHMDSKVFDGRHAENGWLQELPEGVAKTVWGNALTLSPADAAASGLETGDLVDLTVGERTVRMPVLVQPGQAEGVLSAPLGYGRSVGNVGVGVGTNLFPLVDPASGGPCLRAGASIRRVGKKGVLVRTQIHDSMEGRDLIRHASLAEYAEHGVAHRGHHPVADLYGPQEFPVHKWSMVIDLTACIGCGACIVACQAENNIPVVGPEQVAKGREMHWIRVDRYYEGSPEDPIALFQPMLCQHCDKAPCENVCPVNATTHSSEGLNEMAYNRCVGTRYCANNCPYKVRRFNFLDFRAGLREPAEWVFNPEVSLRPRGVMEKCTFCVQRIEAERQRAKAEGRPIRDGDIRPACAAACPTSAITFGDLRDPESRVAKMWGSDRGYRVLHAELGVGPAITYLARLRNTPGGRRQT